MTRPATSLHFKHKLKEYLATLPIPTMMIAAKAGIPRARLKEVLEEPRCIPSNPELLKVVMGLRVGPEKLIQWNPVTDFEEQVWGRKLADEPARLAICGAGNLGHIYAGLLSARPEFDVRWLTSSPERAAELTAAVEAAGGVTVDTPDGPVKGGDLLISADPASALADAEVVLLCLPSHIEPQVLEKIIPHLAQNALLVSIPATGGIHWTAQAMLDAAGRDDVELAGLIGIPTMCKLDSFGERVKLLGKKAINGVATLRRRSPLDLEKVAHINEQPTLPLENFLAIILSPGNQILHPGILYAQFADWDGTPLDEAPLFYEGLTERGADEVDALDREMQAIGEALVGRFPDLDLSPVLPAHLALLVPYADQISDPSTLRSAISTNSAYAGIRTPMVPVDGGLAPNWGSRFLGEDLPYGLVMLKGLAKIVDVDTPTIDRMIRWCQDKVDLCYLDDDGELGPDAANSGAPQAHGYDTIDQVVV